MAKTQYCNCKAPTGQNPYPFVLREARPPPGKWFLIEVNVMQFFSWQYVIGQITENGWAREAWPHHALSPGLKD